MKSTLTILMLVVSAGYALAAFAGLVGILPKSCSSFTLWPAWSPSHSAIPAGARASCTPCDLPLGVADVHFGSARVKENVAPLPDPLRAQMRPP
jgi:hypothetical protein